MEKTELLEDLYRVYKERSELLQKQIYEMDKEIAGLKGQLTNQPVSVLTVTSQCSMVHCTWPACNRGSVAPIFAPPAWRDTVLYGDTKFDNPLTGDILYMSESPRTAVTSNALLTVPE
jgi:hypothetical protein